MTQSAFSGITMTSYWQLGEGATVGLDSSSANDGEVNNFNNSAGTVVNSATPSNAAGSTAYATTSGANFQGLWMFGGGSNNQTVPADNWGVQFNVRISAAGLPAPGTFKPVYGMLDAAAGGLVIEANNIGGTTYFDVNRSAQANLIIPRNASTTVTADTWYNLALVRSGGVLAFYVNGVSVGTSTGSIGTTDGLFALGFKQGVGTGHLAADFDEARFFTFAPGAFNASVDLSMTKRTVTYTGNGNTGGSEPADGNSPYFPGTAVTVLGAGTLTKSGSIFTGWNTQADGLGTSYSPAATFASPDANTALYAQWTAATATITAPATFPAAVTTTYGTVSGTTIVAISGTNLTGDITATAPANLEVSSDNITFGTTATFVQTGGSASGTLYVRIKSNAPVSGTYDSQSIVLTSPAATPVNVATTASGNTVTPKNLTVPGATAQNKMHDGTTDGIVIGALQASGPFGSGSSGDGAPYDGDTLTVSAPGTFSGTAVGGPYTVTAGTFTLGGISAGNYTLTQPTGLSLSASILDTATWTEPAGGSWTDTANWLDTVAGTGADNTADFSTLDLTATTTVTLPSPQTIGGLVFNDTTPDNNWIVSGSTLTLAAATPPVINVIDQVTTINSTLASANGMVKTGIGTLALGSTTSGAMDLTANEGTLTLAAEALDTSFNNPGGLANGGTLTVNSGATLKIANGYNIGYQQAVNINDGTLDIARNFTGDGQNYTLNLNFTDGGSIISTTGSSLRWGELADATITVNGTAPATINCILRMIPGNSRTGTINVVDAAGNLDFYGNIIDYPGIPGGVPLIKTGDGTLTLAGTNAYTSTTTVSAGTLAVTGSLGATNVTVQANATLSGNGNIGGAVTIDSNARHALAVEDTTEAQVTRTITGALTLTAGNILDLTAAAPPAAGVYVLLTATGGITGTPTTVNLTGVSGTVAVNGNNLELTVGGGSTYATWIDGFTFAPGADKTPTGDPDNDGIDNAAEMVLGGDPATGMDASLAPTIQLVTTDLGAGSTNYLLFTFRRTDLSVTAAVASVAQYGTNLGGWTNAVDGVDGVVVLVDDNFTFVPASPNTDRVRVYIPRGTNTNLFGRLAAEPAP